MRAARARRRAAFARLLSGVGLEIGALTDPLPIPHATRVLYSDWLPPEALARMYPGSRMPDIVSDSESFPTVADQSLDFIVANHVLEHVTDPIGALREWQRMLRNGGLLMIALPDKRFTFDHTRARTTLAHLVADHASSAPPHERNRVHLEEWATHVERLQGEARERWIGEQLAGAYTVHNHVWIARDVVELIEHVGGFTFERIANTSIFTNEFLLLLRRGTPPKRVSRWRLRLLDPLLTVAATLKRFARALRKRRR